MGRIGKHLRSNVYGLVAIFIALGGTTYAATTLDKNEVKSKHIGKGQVKNADLANNSVTSPKVADGSLLNQDFAPGQLPTGPQGERGPEGPQGERGLQGDQGAPGISGRQVVRVLSANDANDSKQAVAPCPAGKKAIAGGAWVLPDNGSVPVAITKDSIVMNGITGEVHEEWVGRAQETSPTDTNWRIDVRVICANLPN